MREIARRNAGVFARVVDEQAPALHRIVYRMLADVTEAEDVVQETLLRLWRDAAAWQPDRAGIAAWLTRVAVNLCLDRLRRRRFVSDEDIPERADPTPAADRMIDDERRRQSAVAAIAALSDRQRAAIILTYYEELSNAAAADAMALNLKAFESLLLRARATLRATLSPMTIAGAA